MDIRLLIITGLLTTSRSTLGVNITVGYLYADRSYRYVKQKQGRIISGAMTYAVNQINADPNLLRGHRLTFVIADTYADTLTGTARLTEQWRDGAVAFFGPEDSCDVEARVAASWNLPMISYKCADHKVSDKKLYPTFARTFPPATQVTKSILSLLTHFRWDKFALVVGSSNKWQSIAEKLSELSVKYNMTINGRFDFPEPHMPTTRENPMPNIVGDSYVDTRVYVFLGEHNAMVDLMSNLYTRGLLDTGDYVVIHVDFETFDFIDPTKYFKRTFDNPKVSRNLEAARSLLVIVGSAPSNPDYVTFNKMVNEYNAKSPFGYPNPFNMPKKISVYAAYLYDSVFLYAHALNEVIEEQGISGITNGSEIMDRIVGRTYKSIQGFLSSIDENGDAEGNFTVLSRAFYKSEYAEYSMLPVGHFRISEHASTLPTFHKLGDLEIDWVNGAPPPDEPPCGYRNEHCIPPPNYTLEIACGILGGVGFISAVIALITYRNWRYEQEIAGLLWRINTEEIQEAGNASVMYGSRITLLSQGSMDSKMSLAQIFTKTGTYRGQVVALKKYTKRHLDVTRTMKKEMKIMKDIRHDNVNAFIGACVNPPHFILVAEYCSKGSLQDILENDDVKLDSMFIASLVMDLIKGMIFLHDSELHSHGNLKSSNCLVNSRWTLQVADYGLRELRGGKDGVENEHAFYQNKLWTAPELLRSPQVKRRGTQKGDIYSFAIILYEIIGRSGPFGDTTIAPKEIIMKVQQPTGSMLCRPDLSQLDCQEYVSTCIQDCWSETPEERPDFRTIRVRLKEMRAGMKPNIFDNMVLMMEKYQSHLEELVADRTDQLVEEKKKTEALLHRMLPKSVADQLVRGQPVVPEAFESVTIYFSDICGFTALSAQSSPMQVVDLLNDLYTLFDSIIHHFDVYKVETIGDAYMVVSGLPIRNGNNHAGEIASLSLHLLTAIKSFQIRHKPDEMLKLRIGIHTGSCVAGVVGLTMPRYCLFGDTVNTASRMESNGEPLKIHVSPDCKTVLDKLGGYITESRGYVNMKGKGKVYTYWLIDEIRQGPQKTTCSKVGDGGNDSLSGTPPRLRRKNSKRLGRGYTLNVHDPRANVRRKIDANNKISSDMSILDIMRDSDTASQKSGKLSTGVPSSRRHSDKIERVSLKDYNGLNGFNLSALRSLADSTTKPSDHPTDHVPTIVVDLPTSVQAEDITEEDESGRLLHYRSGSFNDFTTCVNDDATSREQFTCLTDQSSDILSRNHTVPYADSNSV